MRDVLHFIDENGGPACQLGPLGTTDRSKVNCKKCLNIVGYDTDTSIGISPRISDCYRMYYGFDPYTKTHLMREIAEKYDVSPGRISSLIRKGRAKIDKAKKLNREVIFHDSYM